MAQAQVTGEKYYNKVFYEDFGGPLDNEIWQVLGGSEHGGKLSGERCFVENGPLNMIFINDPLFEVTPEYIEWFVDGKVLHRYTYAENDITIYAPYMLKLNFWSSEKWIGGPPEENVVCVYQIDWIKFTPLHLLRD